MEYFLIFKIVLSFSDLVNINVRCSCERTVLELKAMMSKSLYVWMAAYNSLRFSNFSKFLDLCSSYSP